MKQILLICLALLPSYLIAFEGDIHMEVVSDGDTMNMVLTSKGDRMKMTPEGTGGNVIIDVAARKMIILMDEQKMFLERPLPDVGAGQDPGSVEDTGETKEILGYQARKVIHTTRKGEVTHIWATTELGAFALSDMPNAQTTIPKGLEAIFGTTDVFPLESIAYDKKGRVSSETRVVRTEARAVSDAELAPPANYQKMGVPGFSIPGLR